MPCDFQPGSGAYGVVMRGDAIVTDPPMTMFAWFNASTVHDGTICAINRSPAQGFADFEHYTLEVTGGSVTANEAGPGFTFSGATAAGTFTTDVWSTGGAVFASHDSRKAYLNGVPGTEDTNHCEPGTYGETQIGARVLGSGVVFRGFHGCLAHVAIWDIALSDEDMALLSDGDHLPTDIEPDHLVLYMPLINEPASTDTQAWDAGTSQFVDGIEMTLTEGGGTLSTCTSPLIIPPSPPPSGSGRRFATLVRPKLVRAA